MPKITVLGGPSHILAETLGELDELLDRPTAPAELDEEPEPIEIKSSGAGPKGRHESGDE